MTTSKTEGQWQGRPWLAGLVRAAIIGIPVLAGWLVSRALFGLVERETTGRMAVAVLLVVGVAVSVLVARVTNQFLPLSALLRMTMISPDQAPSRLKVARRTNSLRDIQARLSSQHLDEQDAAATMLALVTALSRHDRHTRGHSERVRLFCDLICRELALSPADAGRLRWAALVHDIGKLEVPASVLNKPGKLDGREWDLIREHPDAGARLAEPLKDWLGPWFSGIAEHHERFDGTGYPRGLVAAAISPAGRAIAVVDAYETMTASRSYKSARTALAARAELARCAGTHFDPDMVRAFLAIALPRLLWSVGPLAFLVNAPLLRAVGQGGMRIGSAVSATTASAANVAGVTAVALAVGTTPAAASSPANHAPAQHRRTTASSASDTSVADLARVTPTTSRRATSTPSPPSTSRAATHAPTKAPAPAPAKKAAPPLPPTKKAAPPPKKTGRPAPRLKAVRAPKHHKSKHGHGMHVHRWGRGYRP